MKSKPRGGPRTVNRKVKAAPIAKAQAHEEVFAGAEMSTERAGRRGVLVGPYEEATGLDNIVDGQPIPPPTAVPFTPQPAPWSCQCGENRNSALVDECPVCHAKRPYEYTAPEPVLAVPSDYPQPGESMDDYERRMKGKSSDAEIDRQVDEIMSGREARPLDPGRARELPDPQGLYAKGYASPISFAGPIGSVDVDPLVLQMALDVANKAAQTGVVQSVTVGLKGPSQARVIVRFDLDVASVPWPRAVKDEG